MILTIVENISNVVKSINWASLGVDFAFYGAIVLSIVSFAGRVKSIIKSLKGDITAKVKEDIEFVRSELNETRQELLVIKEENKELLEQIKSQVSCVSNNVSSIMKADPMSKMKYKTIEEVKEPIVEVLSEIVEEKVEEVEVVDTPIETTPTPKKKAKTSYID